MIIKIYVEQTHRSLSNYLKVSDSVCTSIYQGLSLSEYISARTQHCQITHPLPCDECTSTLSVIQRIEQHGWEKLGEAFKNAFPNVSYTPQYARRRLLQMPLVCICVDYKPGVDDCFLLESVPRVNYQHFIHLFMAVTQHTPQQTTALSKQELKSLLSVCKSEKGHACDTQNSKLLVSPLLMQKSSLDFRTFQSKQRMWRKL